MHKIISSLSKIDWKRIAFSLFVLVFLGLLGLLGGLLFLPDWLWWLPYNIADKISAMGHLTSTNDVIHELVFSLIIGTAAIGMLTQIRKPSRNIAGQLMALAPWFSWLLAAILTNNWVPFLLIIIFGGLTLFATIFHPSGLGLFSWISFARVNKLLLTLVIIAAIPLLVLATLNINQQLNGSQNDSSSGFIAIFGHMIPAHGGDMTSNSEPSDNKPAAHDHSAIGHFKNMAAFSFIIILVGLLTSLQPIGWRLTAWVTGLLPSLLGIFSLMFLSNSASLGVTWSLLAIGWGIMFIVAAEKIYNKKVT